MVCEWKGQLAAQQQNHSKCNQPKCKYFMKFVSINDELFSNQIISPNDGYRALEVTQFEWSFNVRRISSTLI